METIQATLHEGDKVLATLNVILTRSNGSLAGSFRLPVQCSINIHVPHQLILADGSSVSITITQLSHFSGDVEFRQATAPAAIG